MEKRAKVQPFVVALYCDNCTEEMELTEVLTCYPPIYIYACPNCTEVVQRKEKFPRIDYEILEN